jgi:hypothetical protein
MTRKKEDKDMASQDSIKARILEAVMTRAMEAIRILKKK